MMRFLKRSALTGLAVALTALPVCRPSIEGAMLTGLSAALSSLVGCLSPGSMSPSTVAPVQQGGTTTASPAVSNSNAANAAPVTNVQIGEAWRAKDHPETAPP